jgi:cytochrome c556
MKRTTWMRAAWISAAAAIGLLAGPQELSASEGKLSGVAKERHELMERFEELTERMFAMVHGELPYSADAMKKAAAEIKAGSGAHLVKLFPEGSGGKPSHALPAIWQEMEFFSHMADRLADFAAALEADASTKPSDPSVLPKKWEDVPIMGQGGPGMMMGQGPGQGAGPGYGRGQMGQGMMGQGMMGQGMMGRGQGGYGMMGGGGTVESDLWHVAHVCNTCHARFREKE